MKSTSALFRSTLAGAALSVGLLVVGITSAHATFVISTEDGDEQKFFINGANKGVNMFDGSVGKNNSTDDVNVSTTGAVTTGNGYANIKPDGGTLTSLTFTPTTANAFDGMFFREQITGSENCSKKKCTENTFDGNITVLIQDNQGDPAQTITFSDVASDSKNFATLGFEDLEGKSLAEETIQSVTISLDSTGVFKEVKQIDFSPASVASGVPEPSTWGMMFLGFLGLGFAGYRRAKRNTTSFSAI